MRKILYIVHGNIKKRSGGCLAMLAYYNALISLYGDKVDIMMPAEADDGSFRNVIPVTARSHIKALLSGSLHRYKSAVRTHLKRHFEDYDLCIINGGVYAGDMMDMIHDFGLKIMVIHHNFEREYAMDNKDLLTFGGRTPFLIIRNESRAYRKADANCFLSKDDLLLFNNYYGVSSGKEHLIGVFEPFDKKLPYNSDQPQKVIAITGSMDTVQTMCGIKDIQENYYDIIRDLCPKWDLVIAGRNPCQEVYDLKALNPEYIKVIPNPPLIDNVTRPASIFLCPTNVGGGLKLRVMDGLRMGIPILVHKVSARGYDVFNEKAYFRVYENRKSFENALKDLIHYCEDGFSKEVIQNDYLIHFSFSSGCERMRHAIESLCE